MNIVIYEKWTHFIPTGKNWANGLMALGHDVMWLNPYEYTFDDINYIDKDIDLVINFEIDSESEDLNNLRVIENIKRNRPDIILAGFTKDFKDDFKWFDESFNVWFSLMNYNDISKELFNSYNMKYHEIPLAADESIFYPLNLSDYFKDDVSFIGQFGENGHGYRNEDKYLFPVIDNDYNGNWYGFSYKNIEKKYIGYEELNYIYNNTKVNLNFHYDREKITYSNKKREWDLNGRVFEISLSGNFQICDEHPALKECYGDSIVTATSDIWLDVVDYYIKNEDKRNEKINDSYKIALEKHTWKKRMESVIEIITKRE